MDIAFVTTRLTELDAQGNFSDLTVKRLKEKSSGRMSIYTFAYERPAIDGVDIHFLGGSNCHSIKTNATSLLNTVKNARELAKYDLLLLAGPDMGAIPAAHMAKRYNPGLKIMWVYHGLTPPEYISGARDRMLTRIRKAAYLFSMKRSGLVQTFSRYIKSELVGSGVDRDKIVPMPFGIDIEAFSNARGNYVRSKHGLDGKFIVLYVGRLAALKRVDDLITAISEMKDKNIGLIIVGGGPEREKLEDISKRLGVEDIVKFAGKVPDHDLPGYYASCDVWATASRHEGFCVPIVEAMAAGKPVIVPEIAAMPETAGDGGLTYPAGNINAFKDAIMHMMENRGLYESLSKQARERSGLYEIHGVLDRYANFILSFGEKR